jgi:hypothetical protein
MEALPRQYSQQTFLFIKSKEFGTKVHSVAALPMASSGVDWSQIHAVRLLGVALAALILIWAIRRMFGGK